MNLTKVVPEIDIYTQLFNILDKVSEEIADEWAEHSPIMKSFTFEHDAEVFANYLRTRIGPISEEAVDLIKNIPGTTNKVRYYEYLENDLVPFMLKCKMSFI